jgi:hypothetical protein
MTEEKYIEKNDPASSDLTFDRLKEEGIRILQELSANHWTDFNLHDPGVTILEQLCYALTELMFKSGFNVEDYLVERDGRVDYGRLALYMPKDILPSNAVTLHDYRKLLFDCSGDLADIWITPVPNKPHSGLYSVLAQPRQKFMDDENKIEQIREEIKQSFCRNRNLGEDVAEIKITSVKKTELVADIEINHVAEPEYILANIYFNVSRYLNPGITYHSFEEVARRGMPVDEILSGPLLKHGWINEKDLTPVRKTIFRTGLMQAIDQVEGVISVLHLSFEVDGKGDMSEYQITEDNSVPILNFPGKADRVRVTLFKDDRAIKINFKEMQNQYWKLYSKLWAIYNSEQNPDTLFKFPEGTYYNFREYFSIQHNFPLNYGINKFGLAESEPVKRKIQAKQLKAYLLVFEQLLANYLGQLSHLKDLYSIDESVDHTYFSQPLSDIPNIGGLYLQAGDAAEEIRKLTDDYDEFYDRRNRFLDYLLSLYGEDFKQKALKRYNYYQEGKEFLQGLIDNKIAFLRSLVIINKNRSKSFNYLEPSWNTENVSGLKHKVLVLLGIRNIQQVSYSDTFLKWGFRLVSAQIPDPSRESFPDTDLANIVVNKEYIEHHFIKVRHMEVATDFDFDETKKLITSIDIFKNSTLPDTLLRYGVSLENFKIGTYEDSKNVIAMFRHPDKKEWQYVSSFKDFHTAHEMVNITRKFLIRLNQDSEGLHIVEHILLRPLKEGDQFQFGISNKDGEELFVSHRKMSFEKREEIISNLILRLDDPGIFKYCQEGENAFRIQLLISEGEVLESKLVYERLDLVMQAMMTQQTFMLKLKEEDDLDACFSRFSERGKIRCIPDNFYSNKISVIFPDWTSRFYNSKFRMLAEETVSGNAPAHIFPEFYWLNPEQMEQFEMLYRIWLDEKLKAQAELEDAAVHLITFLQENKRSGNIYL